jgi:hypothetical protein
MKEDLWSMTKYKMQAMAWEDVWQHCIKLGMEFPPCGRGIDHVLNFISSLAEKE